MKNIRDLNKQELIDLGQKLNEIHKKDLQMKIFVLRVYYASIMFGLLFLAFIILLKL